MTEIKCENTIYKYMYPDIWNGNTVSTEQCECTGKTPESNILVSSGEGERIGPRRRKERI